MHILLIFFERDAPRGNLKRSKTTIRNDGNRRNIAANNIFDLKRFSFPREYVCVCVYSPSLFLSLVFLFLFPYCRYTYIHAHKSISNYDNDERANLRKRMQRILFLSGVYVRYVSSLLFREEESPGALLSKSSRCTCTLFISTPKECDEIYFTRRIITPTTDLSCE